MNSQGEKCVLQRAGTVNRCSQNKQRCVQALLGPTLAPMRRVKQSRALHVHNGDTVNKDRGGEPPTNSTQEFHKQPVMRHSVGQVWLGPPAHALGQGWGRGHPTSARTTRGERERQRGEREGCLKVFKGGFLELIILLHWIAVCFF